MRLQIDWASLIVGSKFTVFVLFYFVFEGNFPSTSPWGAYIWRADLTEGFLRHRFGGLIFGGAYFPNFTVCLFTLYRLALRRRKNHTGSGFCSSITGSFKVISHETIRKDDF